ncbi:hypothetical protein Pyrfu_1654 [Pyrolobus fumarii 1A]|uniref:Uncharacterized protein n=1 Tax=Pyrolobus fumarii (strain DSM 11204 / 1A) TaxID=694429 RepID=G0ECE0_PYRF1|nr:hypothetical protein [Pyrolobus fumarii]AEM39510.1 hypothetical protein Pyrfu_1654 [Pyrolobus fumarii 1A]
MVKRFRKRGGEVPQSPPPNVLFSVAVWRGAEVEHYDVYFEDDGIRFEYLGGYWDGVKPFAGPSRREALLIYSVLKKRRRSVGERRIEDFKISYDDIVRVEIEKREENAKIRLWMRDGRWLEMRIPIKIYDLAYKLLKKRLERRLREKGAWVVRRAR